ncbi:EAL domain-containing protein [Aquibacillus halophilus]|uniref:EAL domain-containing protein n=1 Tax=Aquibacillus halophilus TaxID=930132 RepID=A0A6A8DB77_9BACI|nr:EAL domain-containing protein [Aquibacillus halophilus]MRH41786.1 EAL domain-containing protein [Aquibacillus halophilus]
MVFKKNISFIVLFLIASYITIIFGRNDDMIHLIGGIITSFIPLIAAFWLFKASRRSSNEEKIFWLLFSIGYLSSFIGEIIWDVYEYLFQLAIPFPGYPDFFYLLNYSLLFMAFIYKMFKETRTVSAVRYLFDLVVVMTVASAFSWHYLVRPIINISMHNEPYLLFMLGYPMGDLAILLLATSIYLSSTDLLKQKSLLLLFAGLVTQVIANSSYLYLQLSDQYSSWSLIDPIFYLSVLLIAMAGRQYDKADTDSMVITKKRKSVLINERNLFLRISVPYIGVAVLIGFLLFEGSSSTSIMLGAIISISLIICRQIIVIVDNRDLLLKYRKQARELTVNEQRYRSLFEHHTDAVFSLDLEGNFKTANPQFLSMTGLEESELETLNLSNILPQKIVTRVFNYFIYAKEGKPQYFEIGIKNKKGENQYLSINYIPIFIMDKVNGVFGIAKDVTQMKETEEKINHLAYHDSLTGLPNRRHFETLLNQAIVEADNNKSMLGVLFLDLDHFKLINDTLGHSVGDDLLVSVAERLTQCLSTDNIAARHGGDEFIILLKGIHQSEEISGHAEVLLKHLNEPFLINQGKVSVTPSIGISIYPEDASSSEDLLKNADKAMYRVKYQGKNHYRIYKPLSDDKSLRKLAIEKDIYSVIANEELEVYYQPQIETDTGLIYGVEALVRWNHPEFGLISPADFIPLAEATGVIFPLNEWVLRTACKQLKIWHEQGILIYMAVNISPQQFYKEENLTTKVKEVLDECELDPSFLVIEITEAIAINNMDIAIRKLFELKRLGVQVALDDFGTGYSSLSYLTQLPIDTIKIAREFIDEIGTASTTSAILAALVTMANDLNLKIVLEGVEREEQLQQLMRFRSHYMQGFYFSRPIPLEEMNAMLNDMCVPWLLKKI